MLRTTLKPFGERGIALNKKLYGLRAQSLLALIISLAVAAMVFITTDLAFYYLTENSLKKNEYVIKKSSEYLDRFETYVSENGIAATDSKAIENWRKNNKKVVTIMYIVRDGNTVYDSLLASSQDQSTGSDSDSGNNNDYAGGDYGNNDWFYKREIKFSDGIALVSLYGYFDKWIYDVSFITEIFLSAAVFYIVFIMLIQRKIKYIIRLNDEIKVLETGGLNFPVTVKGKDELASLADSLNQMRLSLSENIETEAAAVKANYDLVVAVSHDLRTPLTSLALYLDLIHDGKCKTEDEIKTYIEKSRKKVTQIRQMTDQLFDRFYLNEENPVKCEQPESVISIFDELFSNMAGYISENGFKVETDVKWPNAKTSVLTDYLSRITDNISSNILKYADRKSPVLISVAENGNYLQIRISNTVGAIPASSESTQVGIANIRFMMEKMNGQCVVSREDSIFSITLLFKLIY